MTGSTEPTTLDKLSQTVSQSAPLVATLLGGPLAGIAVSLLADLFGVPKDQPAQLLNTIQLDPKAQEKLQQLELTHATTLMHFNSVDYATEVEDRKNARTRQIALKDQVPTILALGFLLNYAAIQFYCVTHPSSAIDIISARFQDVLIMIMSYYFGSSHKEKLPQ